MNIFERLHSAETVPFEDPQYNGILKVASRTIQLSAELNCSADIDRIREILSRITGSSIDRSTTVLASFHINLGIFTRISKNVFINHDCTFLDIGGITIEDDVMIGPKVSLLTEGHPLNPDKRKALTVKPIVIKHNAWIGVGAISLPGVTVGENAGVAAGAVITEDIHANTLVAGIPAKMNFFKKSLLKIGQWKEQGILEHLFAKEAGDGAILVFMDIDEVKAGELIPTLPLSMYFVNVEYLKVDKQF